MEPGTRGEDHPALLCPFWAAHPHSTLKYSPAEALWCDLQNDIIVSSGSCEQSNPCPQVIGSHSSSCPLPRDGLVAGAKSSKPLIMSQSFCWLPIISLATKDSLTRQENQNTFRKKKNVTAIRKKTNMNFYDPILWLVLFLLIPNTTKGWRSSLWAFVDTPTKLLSWLRLLPLQR